MVYRTGRLGGIRNNEAYSGKPASVVKPQRRSACCWGKTAPARRAPLISAYMYCQELRLTLPILELLRHNREMYLNLEAFFRRLPRPLGFSYDLSADCFVCS